MERKKIKRVVWQMMLIAGAMLFSVSTVFASANTVDVSLPVKQIFTVQSTSAKPANQTGTYVFSAVSEDAPMPENSQDRSYSFSIQGTEQQAVIPLTFQHGGIYNYTLRATNQNDAQYTYDTARYDITVYVQNEENRLTTQIIVENEKKEKCESIQYCHTYKELANTPDQSPQRPGTPIKTGDSDHLVLWCGLTISALLAMVLLVKTKRSQSEKNKCG